MYTGVMLGPSFSGNQESCQSALGPPEAPVAWSCGARIAGVPQYEPPNEARTAHIDHHESCRPAISLFRCENKWRLKFRQNSRALIFSANFRVNLEYMVIKRYSGDV